MEDSIKTLQKKITSGADLNKPTDPPLQSENQQQNASGN